MPKHKGTDHLLADLRAKISRLRKEGTKKPVVSRFNPYAVERDDCPQIMMVGPPNSGKSSLLNNLTGAASEVADYPHSTVKPSPGILRGDNYRFQLVDLPPVMGDSMEGWMGDLLRHADGMIIVLDVSNKETLEVMENVLKAIDRANIYLSGLVDGDPPLGTITQKAMVALNKVDSSNPEVLGLLKVEFMNRFRMVETSSVIGVNKEYFAGVLAEISGFMRVFTKIPGKKADLVEPYIVKEGITVLEMAGIIHREMSENFQYARIWGENYHDGQRVGKEHILFDGDIVEMH